jgi:hypothetical protein
MRAGHDSNLNRATSEASLALTLPGGEFVLPLDERSRARSGASHLVEMQGQAVRRLEGGQHFHLYGELRQRYSPAVSGMDTTQADFAALWRLPYGATRNERSLALAGGNLTYGGQEVYRYLRLSAARDWGRVEVCQPYVGVDAEQRDYPGSPQLNHRFLQLQSTWVCGNNFPLNLQFGVGARAGRRRPPRGKCHVGACLTTFQVWCRSGRGGMRYCLRHDDDAYSPCCGGAVCASILLNGRVEYRQTGSAWQALVRPGNLRSTPTLHF